MHNNVVDNLKALGVEVELISNTNKIKKTRYVDERTNHMFFRIDKGEDDVFPIAKKSLENINWDNYHAVIISDYCKGFIDEDTIKYISKQHDIFRKSRVFNLCPKNIVAPKTQMTQIT